MCRIGGSPDENVARTFGIHSETQDFPIYSGIFGFREKPELKARAFCIAPPSRSLGCAPVGAKSLSLPPSQSAEVPDWELQGLSWPSSTSLAYPLQHPHRPTPAGGLGPGARGQEVPAAPRCPHRPPSETSLNRAEAPPTGTASSTGTAVQLPQLNGRHSILSRYGFTQPPAPTAPVTLELRPYQVEHFRQCTQYPAQLLLLHRWLTEMEKRI